MGYSIWDRTNGGPANNRRYTSRKAAEKACYRLNAESAMIGSYYVKAL